MKHGVLRDHFGWDQVPRFGGSQQSGTTTTNSNSSPWSGQIPYLVGNSNTTYAEDPNLPNDSAVSTAGTGLLPAAQALYMDSNAWPQYYSGQTYAPLTQQQNNMIGDLTNYGLQGGDNAVEGANTAIAGMLSPGYTAQAQQPFNDAETMSDNYINGGMGVQQSQAPYSSSLGYQNSMINGSGVAQTQPDYNSTQSYLGNMINGQGVAQTQGAYNTGQNYLQGMIGGDTLNPFTSPGFQNVVNGTLASVIPATSASFINGGRADSGLAEAAQTAAATNAVGTLANQNYTQEQGLQQGAESIASQNQNTQLGLQQSAGSLASQNQNEQLGLQSNAATGAQQNYGTQEGLQQAAGQLASNNLLTQQGNQVKATAVAPSVDQAQSSDLQNALSAQTLEQNNTQNQDNAAVQQWNYNQTLPYNMLGMYQGYTGGSYGGSSSVSTPYYQNSGSNILGGLLGGLSIGNSLVGNNGLLGSVVGGTGIFSDERLKTDIKQIGETDNDLPLYSYRYKWDDPDMRRVGLMAQDVQKSNPGAIIHTPFGMAVDYGKALAE